MKKLLSVAITSSLCVLACSSSHKAAASSSMQAEGSGSGQFTSGPVKCQNPISVDNNGGDLSSASGNFQLQSIQVYEVSSNSDSFTASANASNGFKVSMDCQGVQVPQSGSTSSLNANAALGESVSFPDGVGSPIQRSMSISFSNGQLQSASVTEVTSDQQSGNMSSVPKGPIDEGNGTTLTLNASQPDASTIVVKFKMNNQSDDGSSITEYVKATYNRQ